MPDPASALPAVRQALEGVVHTLRSTPAAPPDYLQAADQLSLAIAGLSQLGAPGTPGYGPAAAQIEGLIHQVYLTLEPRFSSHPSWLPLQRALQFAFDTLTGARRPGVEPARAPAAPPAAAPSPQPPAGPLADPKHWAIGLLILRHLYDGDVIEWPIAPEHPKRPLFEELERLGYVARWDRIWPLHDRYRLTERGIQEIERFYRPAEADALNQGLRASGAAEPKARQRWLRDRGYDPWTWSVLHDPYVHWSTWDTDPGSTYRYVWGSRPHHHKPVTHEPLPPTTELPLDDGLPAAPHERPLGDYS